MAFDWQAVVAGSCVAVSAAFLLRRAIGTARSPSDQASGCAHCQGCKNPAAQLTSTSRPTQIVTIDRLDPKQR